MSNYVIYAVDEDYWMPLYVSMHSLLANNRDLQFEIFVLYAERDGQFFDNVEQLNEIHGDFSVRGIPVETAQFRGSPTPHWFTEANLYRFLIGTALPLMDENVLYLDCDTTIDGSLANLFAMDMSGSVARATPEYKHRSLELGLSLDSLFFNAGVMYINLGLWNEHEVGSKVLDCIDDRQDLDFPVQEILNPILNEGDRWTSLHPKYNAMTNWAEVLENETDESPVIVHYTGSEKPWQYSTDRLHKDLWWRYLRETPYRGYRPPDQTVTNRLIKTRRVLASRTKASVAARLEAYPRLEQAVTKAYRLVVG